MGELGRELGGLVGFVVDVTRRSVIRDSGENGDGFDLEQISRGVSSFQGPIGGFG